MEAVFAYIDNTKTNELNDDERAKLSKLADDLKELAKDSPDVVYDIIRQAYR